MVEQRPSKLLTRVLSPSTRSNIFIQSLVSFLKSVMAAGPSVQLQEAKLAQDIHDGALDAGLGSYGVDVALIVEAVNRLRARSSARGRI